MGDDGIPMVAAVSLEMAEELIKYAEFLEEKIIQFSEAWQACHPYAVSQEAIDAHQEALSEMTKLGKQLQKEKPHVS